MRGGFDYGVARSPLVINRVKWKESSFRDKADDQRQQYIISSGSEQQQPIIMMISRVV